MRTFAIAADRWLAEGDRWKAQKTQDGYRKALSRVGRLRCMDVVKIAVSHIESMKSRLLNSGLGVRSINLVLQAVRAVLRYCATKGWVKHLPVIQLVRGPEFEPQWITLENAMKLLRELPSHLVRPVVFTLETGLRKSNVAMLTWDNVDIRHKLVWVSVLRSKSRKAIGVPLSETALQVLSEEHCRHPERVFTYCGRPINQLNTKAFRKALKRAGICRFRWHDLRHTWASWHAQAGTRLQVLQELGGWSSYEMVERYAHLNVDHLRPSVDALHNHFRLVAAHPA